MEFQDHMLLALLDFSKVSAVMQFRRERKCSKVRTDDI